MDSSEDMDLNNNTMTEKYNFTESLFKYEILASKILGKKRVFLYPLPYIIFYIISSVIPHIYEELTKNEFLGNFYHKFEVTTGWIALIVIVSYSFVFYKKLYYSSMKKLLHDKIISVDDFKLAIEELTNKKTFFIYLVVFEFLLNFSWYTDFYSINNIVVKLRWDVPGLVIAIVIIPIAAEIFTGASTASRLPKIIKERININIFHSDQHGGLKPFGNIMLFYVGIYSSTVVISLLVFEEIRRSIIVLPIFIAIFITVVSLPQISLYNLISASKNYWLTNLERRISSIITMKNIDSEISDPSSTSKISSNYLFLKTVKDQIDQVQAWSFDILTLYKVLTILLLPLLPMIIDFLKTVILIKFS